MIFFNFFFFLHLLRLRVIFNKCAVMVYLYCLSIVNFDDMEAEAVHPFSRCQEDAPCRVKMAANVYQDLTFKTGSIQ